MSTEHFWRCFLMMIITSSVYTKMFILFCCECGCFVDKFIHAHHQILPMLCDIEQYFFFLFYNNLTWLQNNHHHPLSMIMLVVMGDNVSSPHIHTHTLFRTSSSPNKTKLKKKNTNFFSSLFCWKSTKLNLRRLERWRIWNRLQKVRYRKN